MKSKRSGADHYADAYFWRCFLIGATLATLLSLLLYLFATASSDAEEDGTVWFVLLPWAVLLLCIVYWLVRMALFRRMVAAQENAYGVRLPAEGAVRVRDEDGNTGIFGTYAFLCDGWLIFPGRAAYYVRHIRALPYRRNVGKGIYYVLTVKTADGKVHRHEISSLETVREIRRWFGRGGKCRY